MAEYEDAMGHLTPKRSLYEQDFYAWANEQAALLRAGKFTAADIENIAEEIESMGRGEKRELVSRLTVLLLHLLKWRYQPEMRGASWRVSIANTRDDLADLLEDAPSLHANRGVHLASAYRRARRQASAETGLPEKTFPPTSPFSFDQALDVDFWPD
jgi:hypothetical protein